MFRPGLGAISISVTFRFRFGFRRRSRSAGLFGHVYTFSFFIRFLLLIFFYLPFKNSFDTTLDTHRMRFLPDQRTRASNPV